MNNETRKNWIKKEIIKIKIFMIIIRTYVLLNILFEMLSSSRDAFLMLSKTTSPQKTVPIWLHLTVSRMFDIYGLDTVSQYENQILGTLPPHLFAVGMFFFSFLFFLLFTILLVCHCQGQKKSSVSVNRLKQRKGRKERKKERKEKKGKWREGKWRKERKGNERDKKKWIRYIQ